MLIDFRTGVVESERNLSNWNSSVMSWSVWNKVVNGEGFKFKESHRKVVLSLVNCHPLLPPHEGCSLTLELELFNMTGTPWANQPAPSCHAWAFEPLKFHGTGQMTLTSPKMSTYLVTPTSNHFCQGLHIRRFFFVVSIYQKDRVSERKAFPEVVVLDA